MIDPDDVIGDPDTLIPPPLVIPTLVTVPLPVALIVILLLTPSPLDTDIPDPATIDLVVHELVPVRTASRGR